LEKAYSMLRETAEKDPLTGVANRRQMDQTIDDQLALLKRTGIPFCIIMTDLDHFKQINDTLGHAAGDLALKLFTKLLQSECRETDLLGRFGGDEFLLLLRQQQLAAAVQAAQRMKDAIANNHPEELASCNFSASLGVTEATLEDTRESLFERADNALYKAKSLGRNRVESD
jgi:diguanylate cyclase (GGDEF)-like protein